MRVTKEEGARLARRNAAAARQNAPVVTTSAEAIQRQIIRDNVATWRRERQKRRLRVEYHEATRNFNSVGNAMQGKRVFV